MVAIQTKIYYYNKVPSICPKCKSNLHHVNALNTSAKVYMVFCTNPKCKYCEDWSREDLL